ncbi:aminoacyl tRNA synthase complex-interacting multifunctional protein 2 isoform X2 [Orussus abietinus]|uniref:aminoacyl tRNA synthase complex-interacting multifunctional protein 2 isoform X2 n=1 Tax=Orussus abietinus TaxID=222816 RepID=UPI000625AC34|nr:aminoacyl tRNA synthase complex-interacting multifunctional protein 2 isoform X2 [Orussus abietinus]
MDLRWDCVEIKWPPIMRISTAKIKTRSKLRLFEFSLGHFTLETNCRAHARDSLSSGRKSRFTRFDTHRDSSRIRHIESQRKVPLRHLAELPFVIVKYTEPWKKNTTDVLTSPLPEVSMLEARQEKILKQLAQLKEQVSVLHNVLKHSSKEKESLTPVSDVKVVPVHVDLIINANLSRPPFCLLGLQSIWKDTTFKLSSYVHSSFAGIIPDFLLVEKEVSLGNTVNVSLIWKEVNDLEVLPSGLPIHLFLGEVNALRFLCRSFTAHNYEALLNPVESSRIDSILDSCSSLVHSESTTDMQVILAKLNDELKKNQWLSGKKEPNVADVAVWSVIKQTSLKKLPSNLTAWHKRCDKTFMFT